MSREGINAFAHSQERTMKKHLLMASVVVAALAIPFAANAEDGATTGAVGGAVAGAIVGGPVGAVVGGVGGAIVGGSADEANAKSRSDTTIIRTDSNDGKGTRKARAADRSTSSTTKRSDPSIKSRSDTTIRSGSGG